MVAEVIWRTKASVIRLDHLSVKQLRAIEALNKGLMLAAWILDSERYVALDCPAPNLFVWRDDKWKECDVKSEVQKLQENITRLGISQLYPFKGTNEQVSPEQVAKEINTAINQIESGNTEEVK